MSNVTPHNGPNRLFRYVDPSVMPSYNMVSYLDKERNLLLINRLLFDQLPWYEKARVLNTGETIIEVVTPTNDYDYFPA